MPTPLRLVSWNIQQLDEAWRLLAADDSVDVALLQEAKLPPGDVTCDVVPARDSECRWTMPGYARSFRTAIARLGVDMPEVLLAEPRKRWGSASPSGVVRINWRIIQAPVSLVDYVVAHELTHLRHPDHTPEFWAAIGRVMPDYEERKQRLRKLGPQLEW